MKINLQKFISSAGYCSRRQAGELIKQGKVKINGKQVGLGIKVDDGDTVEVCGEVGGGSEKNYIKLNKPVGYTCTNRKFKGEKNIFELVGLSNLVKRLFIVGRLDKDSRGLVLLTNDGDFAFKMTHPKFGCAKKYEVIIKNQSLKITKLEAGKIVKQFKQGIDIGQEVLSSKHGVSGKLVNEIVKAKEI
ncbi:pseudouridine synthase, partial [Patescibacteria group bacterium]